MISGFIILLRSSLVPKCGQQVSTEVAGIIQSYKPVQAGIIQNYKQDISQGKVRVNRDVSRHTRATEGTESETSESTDPGGGATGSTGPAEGAGGGLAPAEVARATSNQDETGPIATNPGTEQNLGEPLTMESASFGTANPNAVMEVASTTLAGSGNSKSVFYVSA